MRHKMSYPRACMQTKKRMSERTTNEMIGITSNPLSNVDPFTHLPCWINASSLARLHLFSDGADLLTTTAYAFQSWNCSRITFLISFFYNLQSPADDSPRVERIKYFLFERMDGICSEAVASGMAKNSPANGVFSQNIKIPLASKECCTVE